MTDARLKSIADRINRLMDERDGIASDIRDLYAEAKSDGYIPKALRKAIARMRMDADKLAEEDDLLELYEAALGRVGKAMAAVRAGATLDEAAKANGIDRATLARARAVAKQRENATAAKADENATPPHDAETGELVDDGGEPAADVPRETDAMPATLRDRIAGALTERYGAEAVKIGPQGVEVSITVPAAARKPLRGVPEETNQPRQAAPPDSRTFDEAVGPIPDFLRRDRATA